MIYLYPILSLVGCATVTPQDASKSPPTGVFFHKDTLYRSDGHGDNWCITWAADDSQVTSMDDGNWLKGEHGYHNHLYRIIGGPDDFRRADIPGYPQFVPDGRPFYNHMHKDACIYDWCYDLLSESDKSDYIQAFKTFAAKDHNRGYPPDPNRARSVTGHNCEGSVMTNMMPAGIAIYDEDPEMYTVAARIFFNQHLPACNFYYQSHMHH